MLLKAGVTTAMDFQGPVDTMAGEISEMGYGLNVGVLDAIYPGNGIKSVERTEEEIRRFVDGALSNGALGVKLLGGHYPLTPDTAARIIEEAHRRRCYVAFHAGSTENGSNIKGMLEAAECANGNPLHMAHINSYCRGMVTDVLTEVQMAQDCIVKNPNIYSESYLSVQNGTNGDIDEN